MMRLPRCLQAMALVLLVPLANTGGVATDQDALGNIAGIVRNRATGGAEAGVWVIAETHGLPSVFRRIVVTDAVDGPDAVDLLPRFRAGTHHRQLMFFETDTERFVTIDTAYGTNHLQFDKDDRLWTSGDSMSLGMLDTKRIDPQRPRETEARNGSDQPRSGEAAPAGVLRRRVAIAVAAVPHGRRSALTCQSPSESIRCTRRPG